MAAAGGMELAQMAPMMDDVKIRRILMPTSANLISGSVLVTLDEPLNALVMLGASSKVLVISEAALNLPELFKEPLNVLSMLDELLKVLVPMKSLKELVVLPSEEAMEVLVILDGTLPVTIGRLAKLLVLLCWFIRLLLMSEWLSDVLEMLE